MGALAFALMAVSCTNEDEPIVTNLQDSNLLSFSTIASTTSRGATITSNTDLQSSTIDVFAYKDGSENLFMGTSSSDGVKLTYNNGWGYDDATESEYWPNDTIHFYAISPEYDQNLVKTFASGDQEMTYTVPEDNGDHIDVMYAMVLNSHRNDRDGDGSGRTSGTVNLVFTHILTQISFSAKTTKSSMEIDIESVELYNVLNTATFNLTKDSWGDFTRTYSDYALGLTADVVDITDTEVTLNDATGAMMLIPQTLTEWDNSTSSTTTIADADAANQSYLKIMCKIKVTTDGDSYLYGSATEYLPVYIPFGGVLEQGKQVNYLLTFGDSSTGGSGGGGYDEDGDPILSDILITFDATVNGWSDAGSTTTTM